MNRRQVIEAAGGAVPVLAEACGLNIEEMDFSSAVELRNRRFAVSGGVSSPATSAGRPAPNPDAAVFSACAALDAAEDADAACVKAKSALPTEEARDAIFDTGEARQVAGRALAATTPLTLAGHAARAASALRAAERFVPGDMAGSIEYLPAGLVLAILQDLAAAVPADDAALIADCAEFVAIEMQVRAALGDNAEHVRLLGLQSPLVTRIVEAASFTRDGDAARARCLIAWAPDLVAPGTGNTDQRLLQALLRDLAGPEAVEQACAQLHSPKQEAGA